DVLLELRLGALDGVGPAVGDLVPDADVGVAVAAQGLRGEHARGGRIGQRLAAVLEAVLPGGRLGEGRARVLGKRVGGLALGAAAALFLTAATALGGLLGALLGLVAGLGDRAAALGLATADEHHHDG